MERCEINRGTGSTRDLLNVEYSGILTQVITAFDPGAVGLPRSRSGTNAASDRARATPAPRWAGATFCLGVAGSHCPRATNCLGFPQRHEESRHLFFQGCFKLFQIGKIHSSTQTKQFWSFVPSTIAVLLRREKTALCHPTRSRSFHWDAETPVTDVREATYSSVL